MSRCRRNRIFFLVAAFLSLAVLSLLLLSTPSHAASISVTKAIIDYKNVLRGGYAEDFVYVSSDTEFDVPLDYEVLGDIQGWISLWPDLNATNQTLFVSREKVQEIKIIMQPPADTPTGNYTGAIRILTGTLNTPGGPYGSQLQAAFLIRINLEIVGTELVQCNFGGLSIPDVEVGNPVIYGITVQNTGNVRVQPNISMDIWNQDQSRLIRTVQGNFNREQVLPTTSRTLKDSFESKLRIGQYWAYATAYPCGNNEFVSFSVLEKGAIADYGSLVRLESPPWAGTGEIVPITAIFRNDGETVLNAKFKGTVKMDDKIVQVLDSDYFEVAPKQIVNITTFFTPKKQGQYYISGRILYNNKLSFEKSTILTVNRGETIQEFNMIYVLIIIIILILILVLLIRIKKKRQRISRL